MDNSNILLPFGLSEGKLVHISEVEKGLSCDCICPSCEHQLIARKGKVNSHHFAHYKSDECPHGVETALHMAGKDILAKTKHIILPPVLVKFPNSRKKEWIIYDKQKIFPEKLILEKKLGEIVPDVLIYFKNTPLIIEIVVTHGVNSEKLSKIKEMGISALKIDLSKFTRGFNYDDLVENIVEKIKYKTWLYNFKPLKVLEDVKTHVERIPIKNEGSFLYVNDCPIGTRFLETDVEDDCRYCKFQFNIDIDEVNFEVVECLGKSKISTFRDFKKYH